MDNDTELDTDTDEVWLLEGVLVAINDARDIAELLDELDPLDQRWKRRVSLLSELTAKAIGDAEKKASALIDQIFARRKSGARTATALVKRKK